VGLDDDDDDGWKYICASEHLPFDRETMYNTKNTVEEAAVAAQEEAEKLRAF
jgi:hypothetical protein